MNTETKQEGMDIDNINKNLMRFKQLGLTADAMEKCWDDKGKIKGQAEGWTMIINRRRMPVEEYYRQMSKRPMLIMIKDNRGETANAAMNEQTKKGRYYREYDPIKNSYRDWETDRKSVV